MRQPQGPWPPFTERIGEAMFAPDRAARRLCQGGPGGLSDAAWLLLFRFVAGELRPLVQGLVLSRDEGPGAFIQALLMSLRVIVPDGLGILSGGVALGLLLGRKERLLPAGLSLDLTGQAWIGWLFVQVVATLVLTLLGHEPGWRLHRLIQGTALCFFGLLWIIALHRAHEAGTAAEAAAERLVE